MPNQIKRSSFLTIRWMWSSLKLIDCSGCIKILPVRMLLNLTRYKDLMSSQSLKFAKEILSKSLSTYSACRDLWMSIP